MIPDPLLTKFHTALGEYVFTFETMVHVLKEINLEIRKQKGENITQDLIHVVQSKQPTTLFNEVKKLLHQQRVDDFMVVEISAAMVKVFKLVSGNIELRNDLLHSTFGMMGYPDPETNEMILKLTARRVKKIEGNIIDVFEETINENLIDMIKNGTIKNNRATNKLFIIEHLIASELSLTYANKYGL